MEFDSQLGKLSSLLSTVKKNAEGVWCQEKITDEVELVASFKRQHRKILPYVCEDAERRLFAAFLANTTDSGVAENRRAWHLVGLFELKRVESLFCIIDERSSYVGEVAKLPRFWWKLLYEVVPFCSRSFVRRTLLQTPSNTSPPPIYRLECYAKMYAMGKITDDGIDDLDVRNFSLVEIAYIVMVAVTRRQPPPIWFLYAETLFDNLDIDRSEAGRGEKNKTVASLIARLKDLLMGLSLNDWAELCDMPTEILDKNVAWWVEDEVRPSNQQLLVAHYCHAIKGEMDGDQKLSSVLSAFSRKFDKAFELKLDELEVGEILGALAGDKTDDWRARARVDHLADNLLADTLGAKHAALLNFAPLLAGHVEKLWNNLDGGYTTTLFLNALESCEASVVRDFVARRLQQGGPDGVLRAESLDNDLKIFLNKTVDDADDEKAWLILVLQDPRGVVEAVVGEAFENSGKVAFVASLLGKLPPCMDISAVLVDNLMLCSTENMASLVKAVMANSSNCDRIVRELERVMFRSEPNLVKSLAVLPYLPDLPLETVGKLARTFEFYHNKFSWSVESASIMENCLGVLAKFGENVDEMINDDYAGVFELKLPWVLPKQWAEVLQQQVESVDEILQSVVFLTSAGQNLIDKSHKNYMCHCLAQGLRDFTKTHAYTESLLGIHEHVCHLVSTNLASPSLQHLQVALLSALLDKNSCDDSLDRLVAHIACLPPSESRKLSLTKLAHHLGPKK